MYRKKILLIWCITFIHIILITSCSVVEKIDRKTKVNELNNNDIKVGEMFLETKSIKDIRSNVEKSIENLANDNNPYQNINKTDIIPIITDKDEICNIQLKRLDSNEIENGISFDQIFQSKKIVDSLKIYRNDRQYLNKQLNLLEESDVKSLIEFAETYLNNKYSESKFKWVVEYLEINKTSDGKDIIGVNIRPSYEGVVFARTLVLNNGKPTNTASDFRAGLIYITEKDKIDYYSGISPYYDIEIKGNPIKEILSIESVLSIVANKIDKESISEIKLFELAYRLNKDLSAIPIWNIVVNENGNDRNFQIDAVTGDVYFE